MSWKVLFKLLNDVGKVYEGRSRYLRFFKGLREIEKLYRAQGQDGASIDKTHEAGARLIIDLCQQNGAMWVKVAQYLSCRPDILPKEYINVLAELQTASNHGSTQLFSQVSSILAQRWGERWDCQFSSFDIVPVAIGSIAQVYKARLVDGAVVAVKVRVPGVETLYEQDTIVIRAIAKCLEPFYKEFDLVSIVEEIVSATEAELDFDQERASMLQYQGLKKAWQVCTPEVIESLSCSEILVTSWIEGKPLQSFLKSGDDIALKVSAALETVTLSILEDIFFHGFYHGDPHPGNIMLGESVYLIDFGLVGVLSQQQRWDYLALLMAMMSDSHHDYVTLFESAGFYAENTSIFEQVGIFIKELQQDGDLDAKSRLQKILDALRKNKVILPQGFVGIIRVILLLSGVYQQVDLDFESVFLKIKV